MRHQAVLLVVLVAGTLLFTGAVSGQSTESDSGMGLLYPVTSCKSQNRPTPLIDYDGCEDSTALSYVPGGIGGSDGAVVVGSQSGFSIFTVNASDVIEEIFTSSDIDGDNMIASAFIQNTLVAVLEEGKVFSCVYQSYADGYTCTQRASHTFAFAVATIDQTVGTIYMVDFNGLVVFTKFGSWVLSTCNPGSGPTFAADAGYSQIGLLNGVMYAGSTNGYLVSGYWDNEEASLSCSAQPVGCCAYRGLAVDAAYNNLILITDVGLVFEVDGDSLAVTKFAYVEMTQPVFAIIEETTRQVYIGSNNGDNVESTVIRFDLASFAVFDTYAVEGFPSLMAAVLTPDSTQLWLGRENNNPGEVAVISSHRCGAHLSCSDCTGDAYCYWCVEGGTCLENKNSSSCAGTPATEEQCSSIDSVSLGVSGYTETKVVTVTGEGFAPLKPGYTPVCLVAGVPVDTVYLSDSSVVCTIPPLQTVAEALVPPTPNCTYPVYNATVTTNCTAAGNSSLAVNGTAINCTAANSTAPSQPYVFPDYCLPDNPRPPVDISFTEELYDVDLSVGFYDEGGVARRLSTLVNYGYYNCSAFEACGTCIDTELRPDCSWCVGSQTACEDSAYCDPALSLGTDGTCPEAIGVEPPRFVANNLITVTYSTMPYSATPHSVLDDYLRCGFAASASGAPFAYTNATAISTTEAVCYSPAALPTGPVYVSVLLYGLALGDTYGGNVLGWEQEMYTNAEFKVFGGIPYDVRRVDDISLNIGSGSYLGVFDDFSLRWTAYFNPPEPDNYYFCVNSDDGGRIIINGVVVAEDWTDHAPTEVCSTDIFLSTPVVMVYEFYERGGGAVCEGRFAGGGYAKQIIPKELVSEIPLSAFDVVATAVDCSGTTCADCTESVGGCGWCFTTQTCLPSANASYCPIADEFVTGACPKAGSTEPPFHSIRGEPYTLTVNGEDFKNVANLTCRYTFPTAQEPAQPQYFPAVFVNSSAVQCPSPNGTFYVNETEWNSGARGPPPGYLEIPVVGPAELSLVVAEANVTGSGNNTVVGPPRYVDYTSVAASLPMFDCGAGRDVNHCFDCIGSGGTSDFGFYEACGWCPNSASCAPASVCAAAYGISSLDTCPTYSGHTPTSGSVDGLTTVRVDAAVYPIEATNEFECVFDGAVRQPATVASSTSVQCVSPPDTTGLVTVELEYLSASYFVTPTNDPPAPMAFTYYDCGVEGSCAECSAAAAASKPECGWCVDAAVCESVAAAQCPDFWIDSLFSSMSQDCPAWTGPATLMSGDVSGGTLVSLTADAVVLSTMHDYTCVFEGVGNTNATAVSTTQLNCYSPPAPGGAVSVDVSVMYGDAVWADGFAGSFEYYNCSSLSCATCVTDTNYTECEYCKSADACVPYSCPEGPATLDQCYYSSTTVTSEIEQLSGTGNVAPPDTGKGTGAIIASAVVASLLFCIVVVIFAVREYQSHKKKQRESFEPPKLTPHVIQALCFGSITPLTIAEEELLVKASSLRTLLVKDADRDPPFLLFNVLCDAMRPADGDKFARSIIHLAEDCGGLGEALIKSRISHEMAITAHVNTVFRTNSLATKMFRVYSKLIGMPYVHSTLGYTLNEALASAGNVEVDANKLANDEDEVLNRWTLMMTTQKVSNAIFSSVSAVPPSLRRILGHVQREFADKFTVLDQTADEMFEEMVKEQLELAYSSYRECLEAFTSIHSSSDFDDHKRTSVALENLDESVGGAVEELKKLRETVTKLEAASDPTSEAAKSLMAEAERTNNSIAVGGFFFLRFIVPAITAPESYGMVKTAPSPESRRLLILVSKVIQNLSNNKFFGAKEGYMLKMNSWITENLEKVHTLFESITSYHGDGVDSIHIPSVCVDVAMVTVLRNIENNMSNILEALDEISDPGGESQLLQMALLDELESCLRDDVDVARSELHSQRVSFMSRASTSAGSSIMQGLPELNGGGHRNTNGSSTSGTSKSNDYDNISPQAASTAFLPSDLTDDADETDGLVGSTLLPPPPQHLGVGPQSRPASFMIDDEDMAFTPDGAGVGMTDMTPNSVYGAETDADLELSSDGDGVAPTDGGIPLVQVSVDVDARGSASASASGTPNKPPPSKPTRPSSVAGPGKPPRPQSVGGVKPTKPARPGSVNMPAKPPRPPSQQI